MPVNSRSVWGCSADANRLARFGGVGLGLPFRFSRFFSLRAGLAPASRALASEEVGGGLGTDGGFGNGADADSGAGNAAGGGHGGGGDASGAADDDGDEFGMISGAFVAPVGGGGGGGGGLVPPLGLRGVGPPPPPPPPLDLATNRPNRPFGQCARSAQSRASRRVC
jgi:hypothetical protein